MGRCFLGGGGVRGYFCPSTVYGGGGGKTIFDCQALPTFMKPLLCQLGKVGCWQVSGFFCSPRAPSF